MSIHRHTYPDPAAAAQACARHIIATLEEALAGEADVAMAVSGGSTPKLMFEELARVQFSWRRVHLFWVDERCVPPTHADSNYGLAERWFIEPAQFPRSNVHRVAGELEPVAAGERYQAEIREFFKLASGELPHFDVIHRGMGPDRHTASLFPGEPLIEDQSNLAAAVFVAKLSSWRVTLLPGVLAGARHTEMLVCGADKAEGVRDIFEQPYDPMKYPAQIASRQDGDVTWFLDDPAAALMD